MWGEIIKMVFLCVLDLLHERERERGADNKLENYCIMCAVLTIKYIIITHMKQKNNKIK